MHQHYQVRLTCLELKRISDRCQSFDKFKVSEAAVVEYLEAPHFLQFLGNVVILPCISQGYCTALKTNVGCS